jgi:hypothetical protein
LETPEGGASQTPKVRRLLHRSTSFSLGPPLCLTTNLTGTFG